MKADGESAYTRLAEAARNARPESGIHEFAKSGGSTSQHARVRDRDTARLEGSTQWATAGLVLRDPELLRMAARYALSLAISEHWETGFMSSLPGSPWEDRAFRRSYTAEDIAFILDVGGEGLSDAGRLYLMRRLAEEGIGPINFVTWRHEYIFHCNQLAYFNTGRMYAYLVLEREWPRVRPYTDLAYRDAVNNLELVIMPDGGSLEGPGYLCPTVRENYDVLKHYARARGLEIGTIVPDVLKRTSTYAAAVASTTDDDVIAICDAGSEFGGESLDVLTELVPGSYWTTIANKQRRSRGEPLLPDAPSLPAFVAMPDTGLIASVRHLGSHRVKLLLMGHKAGADHTHEDKGSFVLEFAGEAFALDLGIGDYGDPIHMQYKHCQRHNMLVPVGIAARAHPDRPLHADVKPVGEGDETSFHARIDATAGWDGFYKRWLRTWDSPTPDRLTIRDEYELADGDGVEFYWQTRLPCEARGNTVVITGAEGTVTLTAPEDCRIRIDTLPLAEGEQQNRIAIAKPGTSGTLVVEVALKARASSS